MASREKDPVYARQSGVLMGNDPSRVMRIRAAWIYHIEGKTQAEVAHTLGTSRVTVTRLLSEARKRGEVAISVKSDIADVVSLERLLERMYGLERAFVAPFNDTHGDPTRTIAAAAGTYILGSIDSNMTVGVGWGRTLYELLSYLHKKPLRGVRVISLLGGISEAKRFNPADFAWRFAELFEAEGFLIPAPALVDCSETRHTLLEHCGLEQVFQLAEASDIAILSCGGISNLTTSYRVGHVSESERQSLKKAGAVGDVLYNFIDSNGQIVDHPINQRCVSISLDKLHRIRRRILISGGPEKSLVLKAALQTIRPTVFITDEQSALRLTA